MKWLFKYIPRFYNLPQVIMIRWLDYEWIIYKGRNRWQMYFITVFHQATIDAQTKSLDLGMSRTVGFFDSLDNANVVLKENTYDVHETIYHYAVVEQIEMGVYPIAKERWFYKYDKEKNGYYPIEEPKEFEHYINIALG